jgi:hypothetical protein
MVVKNIHDDAGIVMVIGVQSFGALTENSMGIGKSVDGSMQNDSFLNLHWESVKVFSVNAVGHKIADFHQIIVSGKV